MIGSAATTAGLVWSYTEELRETLVSMIWPHVGGIDDRRSAS